MDEKMKALANEMMETFQKQGLACREVQTVLNHLRIQIMNQASAAAFTAKQGQSSTASATAAWKVMQALGYANEKPFQETQDFLKKAREVLKILEQSGISQECWDGVLGMAATFDVHLRG